MLVTGAAGRLAAAVVREFADAHDEVVAHTRASLDVTDLDAVRQTIDAVRPQAIVNCAAFNDVDGAEDKATDAFAINAFAVRSLARAAESVGATLVHYSTDFVFGGTSTQPYDEEAPTAPTGVYASSKLLGEWFALDAPSAYVLRVESLFGSPRDWAGRRGTLDTIVDGLEQGRDVRVFTDRVVTPSHVPDIAAATRHLLDVGAARGVYHCVNAGSGTWYEVAEEAARLLRLPARLVPITTDQLQLRVKRPRFCALAIDKLAATGFQMPPWREALKAWLESRATPAQQV